MENKPSVLLFDQVPAVSLMYKVRTTTSQDTPPTDSPMSHFVYCHGMLRDLCMEEDMIYMEAKAVA